MSKGYTLNYFIGVFKDATVKQVENSVSWTVSPRYGSTSEKWTALEGWLGTQVYDIAAGVGRFATYGKTARARMLKALTNRKTRGYP